MRIRGILAAAAVAALVASASMIAAAAPASADKVWYQSVGRASASATCATLSAEDVSAGWTQWAGSWEQWANGGMGSFTCTRSITWAKEAPSDDPVTIGCVLVSLYLIWMDFGSQNFMPSGSQQFTDAGCTTLDGGPSGIDFVYALNQNSANAICQEQFFGRTAVTQGWTAEDIYTCVE